MDLGEILWAQIVVVARALGPMLLAMIVARYGGRYAYAYLRRLWLR